eukprot:scaffold833_cov145-Skeletonema_menzelii.AAC.14
MTICIDPKSEILDRKNGRQKLFVHEGKGVGVDLGSCLAIFSVQFSGHNLNMCPFTAPSEAGDERRTRHATRGGGKNNDARAASHEIHDNK